MDLLERLYLQSACCHFEESEFAARHHPPEGKDSEDSEPGHEDSEPLDVTSELLHAAVDAVAHDVTLLLFGTLTKSRSGSPRSPASALDVSKVFACEEDESKEDDQGKEMIFGALAPQWGPGSSYVPSVIQRSLDDSITWAFKSKRE